MRVVSLARGADGNVRGSASGSSNSTVGETIVEWASWCYRSGRDWRGQRDPRLVADGLERHRLPYPASDGPDRNISNCSKLYQSVRNARAACFVRCPLISDRGKTWQQTWAIRRGMPEPAMAAMPALWIIPARGSHRAVYSQRRSGDRYRAADSRQCTRPGTGSRATSSRHVVRSYLQPSCTRIMRQQGSWRRKCRTDAKPRCAGRELIRPRRCPSG